MVFMCARCNSVIDIEGFMSVNGLLTNWSSLVNDAI